jgi:hypothetical protein
MRLLEITTSNNLKVDRANGVIRDVRILGPDSRNRRRYTGPAISAARPLYEGKQVNFDHPPRTDPDRERTIGDRAGWLENVREVDGGLTGDLHLLTADPRAGKILEAAEKRPDLFGLSHNADGRSARRDGTVLVEEITRVRSVDIVSDPATTRSLFESIERDEEQSMKTTLREVAGKLKAKGNDLLVRLFEEEGMGAMADVPVEASASGDSDGQIKSAFRAMVIAAFDDDKLDTKATLKKIGDIMRAQEKLMGGGSSGSSENKTELAAESFDAKRAKAENESLRLLMESDVKASDVQLKALVALESADERRALIATFKNGQGTGREKPKTVPASKLLESTNGEDLPKSAEEFARRLK